MTQRLPCTKCGDLIVPATAEKTGGLCMPCKGGYRASIEESKRRREEERKCQSSPAAKHWRALVERVHHTQDGFAGLSSEEQKFFAVSVLLGEVYNGGFDQYFTNSSGDYYLRTVEGLMEMGATGSLRILRNAKELLFGLKPVPSTQAARLAVLPHVESESVQRPEWWQRLEELDKEFWKDPDRLTERIDGYAERHALRRDF